jgi:hypothetical protein
MTRLRIAFLFVAVVSGDYAVLRLIYRQLTDFGVSAAVCAGSLVTAGLIAHADNRRREAVARGRAAVWQRRDKQARTGADPQCPLCGAARQQPSGSPRIVDRQGGRRALRLVADNDCCAVRAGRHPGQSRRSSLRGRAQ